MAPAEPGTPEAKMLAEKARWTNWLRATGSAMLGGVLALTPVILWFGDIRNDAKEGAALRPRVDVLERHESEDRADARAARELITEVRGDVKELLRRMPK